MTLPLDPLPQPKTECGPWELPRTEPVLACFSTCTGLGKTKALLWTIFAAGTRRDVRALPELLGRNRRSHFGIQRRLPHGLRSPGGIPAHTRANGMVTRIGAETQIEYSSASLLDDRRSPFFGAVKRSAASLWETVRFGVTVLRYSGVTSAAIVAFYVAVRALSIAVHRVLAAIGEA